MSDSMIERVAKAICAEDAKLGFPAWDILSGPEIETYAARARAAIEAMREPTHEMGDAAKRLPEWRHISIWQAMIDAALSEKP